MQIVCEVPAELPTGNEKLCRTVVGYVGSEYVSKTTGGNAMRIMQNRRVRGE